MTGAAGQVASLIVPALRGEFVVRYQRICGRRVFYPIGFDGNGLPTECFVERKYRIDKTATTRSEFRVLCLAETAEVSAVYERLWWALGLSLDWSLRYATLDDHCRTPPSEPL